MVSERESGGAELGDEYHRFAGQVSLLLARVVPTLARWALPYLGQRRTEYQIFADTLIFLPHTWQSILADAVVHSSRNFRTLGQLGRVVPRQFF